VLVAGGITVEVSDGGTGVPVGGGGGGGLEVSAGPGDGGRVSIGAGVAVGPTRVGWRRVADANKAGCVGLWAGGNVIRRAGVWEAVAPARGTKDDVRLGVGVKSGGATRVAPAGEGDAVTGVGDTKVPGITVGRPVRLSMTKLIDGAMSKLAPMTRSATMPRIAKPLLIELSGL